MSTALVSMPSGIVVQQRRTLGAQPCDNTNEQEEADPQHHLWPGASKGKQVRRLCPSGIWIGYPVRCFELRGALCDTHAAAQQVSARPRRMNQHSRLAYYSPFIRLEGERDSEIIGNHGL